MDGAGDWRWVSCAVLAAALAASLPATARADDRSVTIIEGAPEPVQPPPQLAPQSAPLLPLRTNNVAGLRLDLAPGLDLPVGADVVFHVATEKPGYLVLVDINAGHVLTQIYPNVMSLARGKKGDTNLIKPGVAVTIPDLKNPLARFVFRTEPPLGQGVIVAILSEKPVQLIDLPELPPDIASAQASVDTLDAALRRTLVSDAGHPGRFLPGVWSLAAVEYAVK